MLFHMSTESVKCEIKGCALKSGFQKSIKFRNVLESSRKEKSKKKNKKIQKSSLIFI